MARAASTTFSLVPFLAFAVCVGVWGSTWLVIQYSNAGTPPFAGAALRFLLASAILLPLGFALRIPMPRGREQWLLVLFVGLVQFTIDYGLIYWGEQFIASGLTAVLFATLPMWAAIVARLYLGEPLPPQKIAGVLLGIVGVAVLFRESLAATREDLLPMLAILAAAIAVGFTGPAIKKHGTRMHPVAITGWATGIGGLALVPVSFVAGEGLPVPRTWDGWWPILYLAILGSIVTFLLYYWLLQRWSVTNASLISVFTPLVALLLGAAVKAEPLTVFVLIGAACVVSGTAIANLGRTRSKA